MPTRSACRRSRLPPAADLARHPRANRELVLEGRRIAFLLKRSRRRSIGFIVGLEGLAVSAPKWVTLRDIDAAVREKGGWILAKLDEQHRRSLQSAAERIVWGDGATLQFLGAPVRVTLGACPGLAAGGVRLEEVPAGAADEAGAARAASTSVWRTAWRPSGCAMSSRAGCSARRVACSRRAALTSPSGSACA